MSTKMDLLKALEMKYNDRRREIQYNKYSIEVNKISNLVNYGKKVSCVVKVEGYEVTLLSQTYNNITDKRFLKLKAKETEERKRNNTLLTELDKKYSQVKQDVLLFGVSKELVDKIKAF